MSSILRITFIALSIVTALPVFADGNTSNQSFSKAKKMLMQYVYNTPEYQTTIYCNAVFDDTKAITLPEGFTTDKYKSRAKRVEFEHVVPAENFGRTFVEWRDGHPECVDNKGKDFKGRKCAEKVNIEYRYMQSDMYNLFPAIGAVNALRSNYNFVMLSGGESAFGSCDMQIEGNKVLPPEAARGIIARTYMYMEQTYQHYSMSSSQRKLMEAWDKMYPVTPKECAIGKLIEGLQGNINPVLDQRCSSVN